jgi:hypothetical protein
MPNITVILAPLIETILATTPLKTLLTGVLPELVISISLFFSVTYFNTG